MGGSPGVLLKLMVEPHKAHAVTLEFKMASCHSSALGSDNNGRSTRKCVLFIGSADNKFSWDQIGEKNFSMQFLLAYVSAEE